MFSLGCFLLVIESKLEDRGPTTCLVSAGFAAIRKKKTVEETLPFAVLRNTGRSSLASDGFPGSP